MCLFLIKLLFAKMFLPTAVTIVGSFTFLKELFLYFISRNHSSFIFLQELFIPIVWSYFLSFLATQMERNLSFFVNVSVSNESTFLVVFFGVCLLPNLPSPIEDTILFRFHLLLLEFLHTKFPLHLRFLDLYFLVLNFKSI